MKTINDLREVLFDTIQQLKDGKITIEKAKLVGELSQVVVNTAKAEADFLKIVTDPAQRKADGTGFIEANVLVNKTLELPGK